MKPASWTAASTSCRTVRRLDAARRQQVNRWSLSEAEQKWPDFTSLAKELGLRSYLAAGLGLGDQRLGALNLSSSHPDGLQPAR